MENFRRLLKAALCLATAFASYSISAANLPEVDRGITWLSSQVTAGGTLQSESASIATPVQARAEAFLTLKALASPTTVLADTVVADTDANTEYLSRKVLVQAAAARNTSTLIAQVRALQNTDGGFGVYSGFTSNALDTAWALQALKAANAIPTDAAVTSALAYLQSVQGTDGSFTVFDQSSIYVTSVATSALGNWASSSNVTATVQAATNYLLAQRAADGSWGNSVFLTSLVFTAIRNFQPQEPLATSIKTYLTASQAVDGSWATGDPYATALALRALQASVGTVTNPGLSTIRGRTVDTQTGQALSGVTVSLVGSSTPSLATDTNGTFAFLNVQPGSYSLQISFANYTSSTVALATLAGGTMDLGTLQLNKNLLGPTGTVTGVVTSAANGTPLAGVAISVTGVASQVMTDSAGQYLINNVPIGPVTLQATKADYRTYTNSSIISAGSVVVFSPRLVAGVSGTTAVRGIVTSADTGLPMSGVGMFVFTPNGILLGSATTDAQGAYTIDGLPTGSVALQARPPGAQDFVYGSATLYLGSTTTFSPKIYSRGLTPPNSNTASVTGVVMDAGTNQPLANVVVAGRFTLGIENRDIVTGADGRFTFNGLTSPTGTISFALPAYQAASTTVIIDPIASIDLGQVRLRKTQASSLLSDLVVKNVTRVAAVTDPQRLTLTGSVSATIANIGAVSVPSGVAVLAFFDANRNGVYDAGTDMPLGQVNLSAPLDPQAELSISIPVQGSLPFRDAPIHVMADSGQVVVEQLKTNNVRSTAQSAEIRPSPSAFQPVLKWQWTAGTSIATPMVGPLTDTNGDGKFDQNDVPTVIVVQALGIDKAPGILRALSGKDGHELWAVTDSSLWTFSETHPVIADIDGDGKPEVIMFLAAGGIAAINNDGTLKWKSAPIAFDPGGYYYGGISVADIDGDGKAEILVRNYVFNFDGTLRYQFNPTFDQYAGHVVTTLVADLDLDGSPEILAGNMAVHADGSTYWQNPALPQTSQMAVANFLGGPYPQVVAVAGARVWMVNFDGSPIWGPVSVGGFGSGGAPTIADFDGDGIPDIGVLGYPFYYVLNADGSVKWKNRVNDGSVVTGSTAFDFDGDGKAEVVYFDENNLHIYDGTTGAEVFTIPNASATAGEYPLVVDVDGDGHADIVIVSNSGADAGLRVFQDVNNAWVPARKIWNQYNYHITNINDDGSVPRHEVNSWQSNNSYRLNARIGGASGSAVPDLTASYVRVVDQGGLTPSTLKVRIGNAGGFATPSGVKVAFFNGNPVAGGTLLGVSATSVVLNTGEYEDVSMSIAGSLASIGTLYVVADNNGSGVTTVADFDRSNNTVSYVMTAQATSFAAQVSTDKVAYGANANVGISVNLSNVGSFAGSINMRGSIQTVDGMRLATLSGTAPVSLASQASSVIPLTWNTANTIIGDYFAVIELLDADGKVVNTARAMFTIVTDPPQPLASVVYSDKSSYLFGETARVTGRVTNLSVNTLFDAHSLRTKVTGPSGTEVFAATRNLPQLTPGAISDSVLNMSLATAAPGSYIVEQQLINGAGTTVQTKTARFDVRSTADTGAGLKGTLTISPWRVDVGTAIGLTATVTNAGNAAVTSLPAILRIIDPVTAVQVQRFDITLTIGISQQQNWSATWIPAATLNPGTYVAALSIQPSSGEKVLAQDIIQIGAVSPFAFAPITGAPLSSLQTSAAARIGGTVVAEPISVTGGQYSINGGAFTALAGSVNNGDLVVVRQTVSAAPDTKTTVSVSVGLFSTTFDVTTLVGNTTPDPFTFVPQTGVALSAAITSNVVTISGINTTVPIAVVGGTYSVNGGVFTSAAGTVSSGNTVTVRQTASTQFNTKTTATLTVGTISAGFDITTLLADATPDLFSFVPQTGVATNTVATSNTVTIAGINTSTAISITGGTYSLNGGAYTSAAGTLKSGDTLTLRQTSAATNGIKTTATVTVGGIAAPFDVTTSSAVTTPNAFSFVAQSSAALSTVVVSNTVTITGITVAVPISITGGQYSINGGAYTNAAGTVNPNNTVTVRLTSSSSNNTTTSATLTVSTISTGFVVTTQAQQAPVVTNEFTREVRLLVLLSCENSQSNADPVCLEQKKAFLNTYLTGRGLDFKLVTDADSFKSEFRCGRYNTYWIAGGAVKLKDNLAEEIREAVFRGDSLIVDGTHDNRNSALDAILGIQHQGNLPQATSVVMTSAALPSGAFAFSGSANKVALTTGSTLAAFGAANGNAAIVQNGYGQGKSLVYLFDWVGTLQAQSGSALLTATFNQSLATIMPAVPVSVVGDAYVPLDTKLVNAVASTQTVDVIATVPNALVIIPPVTPSATSTTVSGSNTVTTWRITIGANATQYIDWAVRAPTTSGTYVIGYQVNLINGTTSTPLTSNNLSIVVQGADQGAAQTVSAIQALAPTNASERNARDRAVNDVQTANTKLNAGLYEDAVTNYLAATTELANITTVSVTATEAAIDRLLQEAGRKWCRAGTSCAVSSAGLPAGYNVTVFGSASFGNGQADGSIGVGGAASLSSYTVASALSGDLARLIVGGSLSYSNGSVGQNGSGVIKVGGSASVSQNVGRADLKTATAVENWPALKTQYLTFADRLATLAGTAATIVSGNQFNCTGTNATFNVCNLTGSQLTQARTLNLNYPNTASVLVNVSGTAAATMTNGQANWNGQALSGSIYASRVFFNFSQATGLTISGFGIGGTILAPRAALVHSNSLIDGQVIVNTLSSTGSYKCSGTFQGSLPNLP